MVKDIYECICRGEDVRANLIRLKVELKNEKEKQRFVYLLGGNFVRLSALLEHEDAKVRKNAALILGELESEDVLPGIFEAYKKETQLFVRADYLKAAEKLDVRSYLPELKKQQKNVMEELESADEAARKHLREEAAVLSRILLKYEKHKRHSFIGEEAEEIILLCNRMHREITARQIKTGTVTLLGGGVRIQNANLSEILKIRTWQELLFPLHGRLKRENTPEAAAEMIMQSDIFDVLEAYHTSGKTFLFRLDYKGGMEEKKRGDFLKKTASLLEEKSERRLVNSISDYEVEIRLIESKKGGFVPVLKLYTLSDKRFAYRKGVVAASMAPVNAALIMQIAGDYLKENAQVLDPFCGVGTMLIERNYYRSADPLYGVDIFGKAIQAARENSEWAKMPIHYINRDFFEFQHDYLFDEVVTDMPPAADEAFYKTFFAKVEGIVRDDAIMVLYNRKGDLLERMCEEWKNLKILKKAVLNERQNSLVMIGQLRRQ